MADMLTDGAIKVTYVPTIANIAAPTVAELGAGLDLECLITADGLNVTVDEETVSIPKLCDTTNSEAPGRATYSIDFTFVRKTVTGEDEAWATMVRKTPGFIVFRYGPLATQAYAAADPVQVFPGQSGERRPLQPEANSAVKFSSKWFVDDVPDLDAVVAA
ncbi:hypothetical protein VSH64_24855 [Amycolatopsis rhabdoformis]|uniref:Uncharacterized protein n=1 Tax=Amycolatopsis rhabdoformis TaxID=1448059 RepID=A0ABZ1HXK2_9PSEU|nr:hypothetical protein [Amycolatopsis rhabdoformis]WSE26108.1 hypothetical protein VSH64_24855 [Amycolatopsis rhabdoformis]